MTGLEISKKYFEEYGKPMLERDFADALPYLAAGFTGSGSEHFGFDDEISRDHDFEPGFCLFLPGENIIDRRTAFLLERAYSKLPAEFCSVKRGKLSPVGGNRHGVMRTADFYLSACGCTDGNLSTEAWLHIPDYALAQAANGEIFFDNYGEVTAIRNNLADMPRDILLKRLAGNLLVMGQSGQYNFTRCLGHGEPEAAQLALTEFVRCSISVFFLLNGKYAPFYKWSFRALRNLPNGEEFASKLSVLLRGDNTDPHCVSKKSDTVEDVSAFITEMLRIKNYTDSDSADLERHAYSVNNRITDGNIRNMHILETV